MTWVVGQPSFTKTRVSHKAVSGVVAVTPCALAEQLRSNANAVPYTTQCVQTRLTIFSSLPAFMASSAQWAKLLYSAL